ncbi:hypothetical protein E5554_21220 [Sphingobium sp. PAMC28499]|uniref:baseplate J/gp47 family protein n=1 Tax=Sphingobium sp. PAMC28499 TaxID=2565554 RepID=UPI00109DFBAC|nr:baseplate J/gp47 family protein [Sphingobium sp. PAMC28499]QCB40134.1 hypothetical protein E5554_21220 [Sphingobium sp. PAMC28499]
MTPKLDGRSQADIAQRLLRDAAALLGHNGEPVEPGRIGGAIIASAARLFEEVTRRLDRAPDKQADNFYTAMGLGRDPAQPAGVPVAIALSDNAPDGLVAEAGTKLTADVGGDPAIFETQAGIALARGKVTALTAADLTGDRIFLAAGAVVTPVLPRPVAVSRFVRSAAGAGATMLQIDPAQGLAPGMTLRFGSDPASPEYDVTKVENDVVTITPALEAAVAERAPVTEVASFAPFAPGARDRQSHSLYLSHPTLLDVPAALTISVGGVASTQTIDWRWFGRKATDPEGSAPDWQDFDKSEFVAGAWRLTKAKGKPEKTDVNARNGLWLRGRLTSLPARTESVGQITLAVASEVCKVDHHDRCEAAKVDAIDYEAVAVTTPVVPNKPYYPFGREPRLFDAFYIGCAEAFGKAGAEARLCFTIGGASLGALTAVFAGRSALVFGVGTDRQLYLARFTPYRPSFAPMPGPKLAGQPVFLASQAPLSASATFDGMVRLAVAGDGAIHVAEFPFAGPFTDGLIPWRSLALEEADAAKPVRALFVSTDDAGSVHALVGDRILIWTRGPRGELTARPPIPNAVDLLPLQGPGADAALLISAAKDGSLTVEAKIASVTALHPLGSLEANALPSLQRAAWASQSDLTRAEIVVAGYEKRTDASTHLAVRRIDAEAPASRPTVDDSDAPPLPISFEAGIGTLPTILIADAEPIRFLARGSRYTRAGGVTGIGASANGQRRFLDAGWTVVQDADQGLLYRSSPAGGLLAVDRFHGVKRTAVAAADIPTGATWFIAANGANGEGFVLAVSAGGNALLLPLIGDISPPTSQGRLRGRFLAPTNVTGSIRQVAGTISLAVMTGQASDVERSVILALANANRQPLGLWALDYTAANGWTLPPGSPALPAAATAFTLLRYAPDGSLATIPALDYFAPDSADLLRLDARLAAGPLSTYYGDRPVTAIELFNGVSAIAIDHDEVAGALITLALPQTAWSTLGPDEPANPALSWEYWNGSSWWALDSAASNFLDRTGNLLVDGGVYFRVPADLQETEVGGRKNRWIRARLVGGDYGEARVSVHTVGPPDDQTQTIIRDLSVIRAPYVVRLRIGYCAGTPTPPDIVLTADNLDALDQSEANKQGLSVRIFQTVADALAPAPQPVETDADIADCCRPAPPPPPPPEPDPEPPCSCEAEGAAAAPAAARTILIGFDQPVRGSPLSLYVDAVPVSGDWTVTAEVYRKGRFTPARVISDSSSGLGESGVIAIEMLEPPDRAQLLGASACWLRLSPVADAENWSPRLRGVYLNGVMAASVETRSMETIGTSDGSPDQSFRLFADPVDGASLDLWLSEQVGEDEGAALAAEAAISGMPGPWVRWTQVREFPSEDQDAPARLYAVDEQSGLVSFGNGRNALAPPMGSGILARSYRHVTGTAANAVAPGDKLQPISPLAGVDQVMALDGAQGGTDVEAPEQARARAPVKLLNGGRIVTLGDVENYVRARFPTVAQASAAPWRGASRLVVVGRGDALIPPPAALKAVAARLHGVASFGLLAPGRLVLAPPRLLNASIDLSVDVDPGVDYSGVEQAAKRALAAFFHPETGGHAGQGWPVGAAPTATDVAAALADLGDRAVISAIVIVRADTGAPLPDPLPADVLVLVARAAVTVHLFAEAGA